MAKRQKLDYSVRQAIVNLHKEKHTIREISEKVKRSKSVVDRVVKSYNDTGKIVSAFKTGRPRKTSIREDRIMQRMSLKDRFKSCTEIKKVMNSTSCVNVSRQTASSFQPSGVSSYNLFCLTLMFWFLCLMAYQPL